MPNLHRRKLASVLVKKWNIVKGDLVSVMRGKDFGKQGLVKKVFRDKNRLIVEGCNLVKKRLKPQGDQPGYVLTRESTIHYSNVMLVDPKTGKPTRIGYRFLEDGSKVRYAKKSGSLLPKPQWKYRTRSTSPERDTTPENATKMTYTEEERTELKNRFLRLMELGYYNVLKAEYAKDQEKNMRQLYEQKIFQMQVYQRAQELLREKKASK